MGMSVELVDVNSSEDQGSCEVEVDHIPPLSEVLLPNRASVPALTMFYDVTA